MESLLVEAAKTGIEVATIVGFLWRGHSNVRKELALLKANLNAVCTHLGLKIESGPHIIERK